MATLGILLLFASLLGLIIGLAKPSALKKITRQDWNRKTIGLAYGTLLLLSSVILAVAGGNVKEAETNLKTNNSTPVAQEAVKPAENSPQPQVQPAHSVGYGLAKLHAGSKGQPEPDQALVIAFEQNLKNLNEKCTEDSEERIADAIVVAQKFLKEKKNVKMDLPEVADGILGSIPDEAAGSVSCAEIAATFVTLVNRN